MLKRAGRSRNRRADEQDPDEQDPYDRSPAQWAKLEAKKLFNGSMEQAVERCDDLDAFDRESERAERAALRKFNWHCGEASDRDVIVNRGILIRWLLRRKAHLRSRFLQSDPGIGLGLAGNIAKNLLSTDHGSKPKQPPRTLIDAGALPGLVPYGFVDSLVGDSSNLEIDDFQDEPLINPPQKSAPAARRAGRRPVAGGEDFERVKKIIREMKQSRSSCQEICARLGTDKRPPHAAWRDLSWPEAFRTHQRAVKTWISRV